MNCQVFNYEEENKAARNLQNLLRLKPKKLNLHLSNYG